MNGWIVYRPLGTDPYLACRDDGGRVLASSDLEALRRYLRAIGLRAGPPHFDDAFHVVERWQNR